MPFASKHSSSGPVVWASIFAATCLLLFAFQKILWLVVPFLLACVIYYALYPLAQKLMLAGMAQEQAAAWVAGSFTLILGGVLVLFSPWLTTKGVLLMSLYKLKHLFVKGFYVLYKWYVVKF